MLHAECALSVFLFCSVLLVLHVIYMNIRFSFSVSFYSFLAYSFKALHEALMRQEELLAYIDRQEEAKFRVGPCFSPSPSMYICVF